MKKCLLIFVLFISNLSFASESSLPVAINFSSSLKNDSDKTPLKVISVLVEVDGLGKISEVYTEILPIGSTTADVLKDHHQITRGQICLDEEGILSIDGLSNYWIVSVNGDYVHSNSHTILNSGDQVKWQFKKEK